MENNRLACSVVEAAEMLGVSPKIAYQLSRRADFPCFKVGSRTVVSVEGLKKWVEKQAGAEVSA